MSDDCPCGSGQPFSQCCGPFLQGDALPATPLQLMRSRYTAYTKADIDYIQKTMCAAAATGFDPQHAAVWAKRVKWKRLKVLKTSVSGEAGMVEFVAIFSDGGRAERLHECSAFQKIAGRWFYVGRAE